MFVITVKRYNREATFEPYQTKFPISNVFTIFHLLFPIRIIKLNVKGKSITNFIQINQNQSI
jgi:hypothetical protein